MKKHISALHPGPPPTTTESREADKDDGGEVSENAFIPVTSKCMRFVVLQTVNAHDPKSAQ